MNSLTWSFRQEGQLALGKEERTIDLNRLVQVEL